MDNLKNGDVLELKTNGFEQYAIDLKTGTTKKKGGNT